MPDTFGNHLQSLGNSFALRVVKVVPHLARAAEIEDGKRMHSIILRNLKKSAGKWCFQCPSALFIDFSQCGVRN